MSTSPCSESPSRTELFSRYYEQAERAVRAVARRRRLGPDDRDELRSLAAEKLLEKADKIFGALARCEYPSAFLERIVDRLWVDLTNQRWGRWRPTVKARRLGTTAVELDRLVRRDRIEPAMALELLAARRPSAAVVASEAMVRELAAQRRPDMVPLDGLDVPSSERVAGGLERERRACLRPLLDAVRSALAALPPVQRRVLRLRFLEGLGAPAIAGITGLAPAEVYRKLYAGLDRLERELRQNGFGPHVVREVTASDGAVLLTPGCLDEALATVEQV